MSLAQSPAATQRRRHDLDWIRVGAFGLLMTYHVGALYVSPLQPDAGYDGRWIELVMAASHPWRMCLLFFLSGTATAILNGRPDAGLQTLSRVMRFVVAMVFGALVINAPQMYLFTRETLANTETFPQFLWNHHLLMDFTFRSSTGSIYLVNCLHLWFLAYLCVYTLVVFVIAAATPSLFQWLGQWLERHLRGWRLLVWPTVFCFATRAVVHPLFDDGGDLFNNWYSHFDFMAAFVLGYAVSERDGFWQELVRVRGAALALAVAAWGVYAPLSVFGAQGLPGPANFVIETITHSAERWGAIVAVLGFGATHLNRTNSTLRYLRDAILPYYLVHATALILIQRTLSGYKLPMPAEAALVTASTLASCAIIYEMVRRTRWLRVLFGLKLRPRPSASPIPSPVRPSVSLADEAPIRRAVA